MPLPSTPPASVQTPPPPRAEHDDRFSWRSIFEHAAVGMALVGPTGRWIEVNTRLTEIVGYSRQELLRRTFQQITHPEDLDSDLQQMESLLRGDIDSYNLEKRYLDPEGRIIPVQLTVALVRDPSGEPDYFISVVEDRRQQVEAQRRVASLQVALARKVRQLEATNQELKEFGDMVSHDLKAPLRAIRGFADLALEELEPGSGEKAEQQGAHGAIRGHLQRVFEGAERMRSMIDGLHQFSRLGRCALSPKPMDPAVQVRRQFRVLSDHLQRVPELVLATLPPCVADPVLMERVWSNLLANAIKFTQESEAPRIEVGGRLQDGEPTYFVRDNGVGFESDKADHLFTVFRRLHRDPRFPGQGIGLALVRRIVNRHGGRVWAEGEPGRGATLHFTLPDGDLEL